MKRHRVRDDLRPAQGRPGVLVARIGDADADTAQCRRLRLRLVVGVRVRAEQGALGARRRRWPYRRSATWATGRVVVSARTRGADGAAHAARRRGRRSPAAPSPVATTSGNGARPSVGDLHDLVRLARRAERRQRRPQAPAERGVDRSSRRGRVAARPNRNAHPRRRPRRRGFRSEGTSETEGIRACYALSWRRRGPRRRQVRQWHSVRCTA